MQPDARLVCEACDHGCDEWLVFPGPRVVVAVCIACETARQVVPAPTDGATQEALT